MESPFSKSSGLTVYDSERDNSGVCFQLHVVMGLFSVKLQDFIINSSDGFCDRVCDGICLQLQSMTDRYLEKVQAFITNNGFGMSIT